jgi:hypothetical protein
MLYTKKAFCPSENVTLEPDKWVEKYAKHLYNYALKKVNDSELSRDWYRKLFLRHWNSAISLNTEAESAVG